MNPIDRAILSTDWITIALFLSMVFLALGKYLFQNRFSSFIALPFNNKYIVLYNKKGQRFYGFHMFLTLFQLINFALFLFICQKNLLDAPLGNTPRAFFTLMGWILLFQLLKLGTQRLKGLVFNTQGLVSELLFYKTSYLNYSGLIMGVGNIILVYIVKDPATVLYVTILLFFFTNGIGVLRLLKDYQNIAFPYFSYFILYLCTLDIAPLLLLVSYVRD